MLVERHATETYRLCAAIVGTPDARDLTQETFLVAWRELPRLRDIGSFAPWLRRICVSRCRNWLRAQRGVGRPASLDAEDGFAESIPDGRRDFRGAVEARAVLEPAFRHLNPDQRAVLALHYSMGYSISETADALGVSLGAAKSRLHRGLKVLRAAIGSGEGAAEPETAR